MATTAMRRAEFLMALAYANRPRHRAVAGLRAAVLRAGDADRRGRPPRRPGAPERLSPGPASLHRLQRRHASAGIEIRRRNRAPPGSGAHRHGQPYATVRDVRPRVHQNVRGHAASDLAKAVQEGLADAIHVSVPILAGHCEVARRIAERWGCPPRYRRTSASFTSAGRARAAARPEGRCREVCRAAGDAAQDAIVLNEAHGARPWPR